MDLSEKYQQENRMDIPTLTGCACDAIVWKDLSGVEIEYCKMHGSASDLKRENTELKAKLDQANKIILIAAKAAYYDEIINTLMVDNTEESPQEWTESRIDEWREQAIAAIEAAKESE